MIASLFGHMSKSDNASMWRRQQQQKVLYFKSKSKGIITKIYLFDTDKFWTCVIGPLENEMLHPEGLSLNKFKALQLWKVKQLVEVKHFLTSLLFILEQCIIFYTDQKRYV